MTADPRRAWTRWARPAAALAGLVALTGPLRPRLEATMTAHMVVQYPLLVLVGVVAARSVPPRLVRRLRPYLPAGVPALLAALAFGTAAMVPRVVDAAVLSPEADALKTALLIATGALGTLGWRPAGRLGQAFVVGNGCWMLAAGGLVLAEAPVRVCASYLEGDQARAGHGLVAWAVAVGVAWLAGLRRRSQFPRKEESMLRYGMLIGGLLLAPGVVQAQAGGTAADAAEEKLDYELREVATAQEKYYVEYSTYARNPRAMLRYYKAPAGTTLVIVNASKTGFSAIMVAADAPDVVCGIAVGTATNPFGGYHKDGKPLCRER